MYLTADEILSARDLPTEDVAVPEWGGVVCVRTLTGAERDAFESSMVQQAGKSTKVNTQNLRAKLVALCAVNESGQRVFTDAQVVELGRKSSIALNRVFAVAQRLSGLSDADVEELGKASETDQLAALPSDSPDASAVPSENS